MLNLETDLRSTVLYLLRPFVRNKELTLVNLTFGVTVTPMFRHCPAANFGKQNMAQQDAKT